VKASIVTLVQLERLAALATLLTTQLCAAATLIATAKETRVAKFIFLEQ
jgi:hypothetical protein